MKTKLFMALVLIAFLNSCDTPQLLDDKKYSFFIFQYTDESNKEWIITSPSVNGGISTFPKRYRGEPYFQTEEWAKNPEKYNYDKCELATATKLLYLHGNYHSYFPYKINTYEHDVVREGQWNTICNTYPLDLPVRGSANKLYKEIRHFDIRTLERLTGKSRTEMTIEDIENAINELIDDGKLEKYSTRVYNMWQSL